MSRRFKAPSGLGASKAAQFSFVPDRFYIKLRIVYDKRGFDLHDSSLMALSFVSGTTTLANWGFGAGDIAVIAGAGRAVGNWLMAQRKDRALLEFLAVQPEDIIQRKGLVDIATLHNRWDQKLVLLRNGRRHTVTQPGGVVVENMDSFTWFMTLVVAALDCTLASRVGRTIVSQLLVKLIFDKSVGGVDYLLQEMPHHIQGWRSTGCVRSISQVAHGTWHRLARERAHLPGDIPELDSPEILRLLIWIASGKDNKFVTSSTDAASFAKVLAELGLELLLFGKTSGDYDENRLVVILSTSSIPWTVHQPLREKRRGMRIPLNDMEECVTIWPGDINDRNNYRGIFSDGMRAAAEVRLVVGQENMFLEWTDEENRDIHYNVETATKDVTGRVKGQADHTIVYNLLLSPTPQAKKAVHKLTTSWPEKAVTAMAFWLGEMQLDSDKDEDIEHFDTNTLYAIAQLEVFILGYYYAILSPLVDTSQTSLKEVYGSWGWNDVQILKVVRQFTLCLDKSHTPASYPRHQVMKLAGYFLAGADYREQLLLVREGTVGVLGKLALVTGSVIGGADTPAKVGKFWLLDVDPTCIASNSRGIVECGIQKPCKRVTPAICQPRKLCLSEELLNSSEFTSHIEPDWDYDVQRILVAYRHHGRIIHRLNPVDTDISVLNSWTPPAEKKEASGILELALPISLEQFYGGYVVRHEGLDPTQAREAFDSLEAHNALFPRLVVLTGSAPKTRACLAGMYRGAGSSALYSDSLTKAAEREVNVVIV